MGGYGPLPNHKLLLLMGKINFRMATAWILDLIFLFNSFINYYIAFAHISLGWIVLFVYLFIPFKYYIILFIII